MPRAEDYTVEHAARRMGVTPGALWQQVNKGQWVPVSTDPITLPGDEVDRRRAARLRRFEDIVDTSERAIPSSHEDVERAERAEQVARDVAAATELMKQGTSRIRRAFEEGADEVDRAQSILVDALLGSFPLQRG